MKWFLTCLTSLQFLYLFVNVLLVFEWIFQIEQQQINSQIIQEKISFYFDISEFMEEINHPQKQTQMKMKSLTQIFEEKQVTQNVMRLKEAIIKGDDVEPILEEYRKQFSKKTIRIVESIVNSDIVKKIYEKKEGKLEKAEKILENLEAKQKESPGATKRLKLNQLFAKNADIKREFIDLKNALMQNADITKIMQFYDDQLGKKELTAIKNLLNSEELKNWKKQSDKNFKGEEDNKETRIKQLEQIFNLKKGELKGDFTDLKKALIQNTDISKMLTFYEDQLSRRELNALKAILDSEELKAWKKLNKNAQSAKKLNKLFQHPDLKSNYEEFKNHILNGKDVSVLMEYFEQQLSRRQLKALKNMLQSKEFTETFEVILQTKGNDSNKRMTQIKDIFKQMKSDVSQLINAVMCYEPFEKILQKYEEQFPRRQYRFLSEILGTQRFKSISIKDYKNVEQERAQRINELFKNKQIKFNISQLISLIIARKDITKMIQFLQDEAPKRQFATIQNILNSNQMKELMSLEPSKIKLKLDELFKNFKTDLSKLKEALLIKKNKQVQKELIKQYKKNMPNTEFLQLISLLNSKRLQQILSDLQGTQQQQPDKQQQIKKLFVDKNLQCDIDSLVNQILDCKSIEQILKKYQWELSKGQFRILKPILLSKELKDILNKSNIQQIDERQTKINELLSKKHHLTHYDLKGFKAALLKNENLDQYINKFEEEMKGGQFRELKAFLASKQLKQILNIKEQDSKKIKLIQFFKSQGINIDLNLFIEAVLNNEDTTVIIQNIQQNTPRGIFRSFQKIIQGKQFKKLIGKPQEQDLVREQLSTIFEKEGFGVEIQPLKELILKKESTQQMIKKYQQTMTGKNFMKLQKIMSSQQIKNIFGQKHEKDLFTSISAYFKNQGINKDVRPLIDLLIKGSNIEELMNTYRIQMTGGDFRKLKTVIQSAQLQTLLDQQLNPKPKIELTPIQSQKMAAINSMLEEASVKSNNPQILDLKMAILQKRQYNQILNTLSIKLSGRQYLNIQNLLKSNKFNSELKKIEISRWKQKYDQLMGLIKGIQISKNDLVQSILLNMSYCNNILEEIREKQTPDHLIEFDQSISSKQYHQFFVKHNLPQPVIQKKQVLYIRDKQYFVAHETPLSMIRKKYQITDDYKFFNLKDEAITAQTIIEPIKLVKCTQFSVKFQGENKNIFLPSNITLKDSKPVIKKILNTKLQLEVLVQRNENLVQQVEDFILQTCSSKRLAIPYYINLILTLNQDVKDRNFKSLSHKSVMEVKNLISTLTGIKAQAQRWYIDNKEVLNNKETLESLGIKEEYFRITIIELKSLQYYGFMKQKQIKRSDFKDFFIEDDKIFCQNIIKSKFPADQYSEVFRNQILGYIFAAIKKHSLIESSLNHIKSLVQSTRKEEDLWKPPSSQEKCFFNETFVLYYILRCSQKSLRIDLLRGVMSNVPVPLAYYDKRGKYVELMEENYWIQNKAFTIVSFGHGDVMGKSQLLNIIFETNFKNRDNMHKQCQGGIEIQYNIYKSDEYSVNLIDVSNEIEDRIKIQLAKSSNLVIIQTKKGEEQATNWISDQKFDIPMIVILRDVQNAFERENRHNRSQMKKINDNNTIFNKYEIIPYPLNKISFYNTQINEIANGIQQFIRKNYKNSRVDSLWKFSDFLADHTDKKYVQFNNILKEIESSKDNLTKVSCFFNQYKILEAETEKDNQEKNIKTMDNIKKKAVQHGLADPLKKIISFYQQNFTLSSQIMCKIRIFLTLLRNELFRQFNHLEELLKDAQKKKEKAQFQTVKVSIVEKLKSIKNLKDSLTTPEVKIQVQEFIQKASQFKSSKDWETIIKKIKNQFEFQIQPKAFSVENFWREVICLSKFDPNYTFTVKNETIYLTDAIINLGRKEVQDSQNFEVINGDLLQMPTQYLRKIFEHQENKKVMVVAIFGPQSSGKSTLLNFVLGCDFMSSAGRCTKGIYGTYFQICNRQMPNCDAILVLDTQGLFSNYENKKFANRKGFDNKLVLFCLQVCDLIILNTKGDVTKECQQILQAAYDSEALNEKNLPQLYFVLNLNGGQMNTTQNNQVEKFCDTVIAANPHAAKFVCKNHAVGMPMAFNEIPRKSTAQYVTKYLKPKTLPSQRFYKETKNLCYNIMDLITERGREKQGRTLQEVFKKMDQTWSTINKYPILTKHGNKKIRLLDEKINLWKKTTKQNFINLQANFQEDLKNKKLSQLESWSKEKQKVLYSQIQKAVQQFQTKFPIIPGQLAINACIKKASIDIQPTLNNSFQALKQVFNAKKFEKQIQQSQKKGFDDINFALKSIKQAQAQTKLKVEISQDQKIKKFEQCWGTREKEMKKKIDRKALALENYTTTLQMYNGQLQLDKRNKSTIEIPAKYLKDYYQDQIAVFREKLNQYLSVSLKNEDIFESSNKQPVMNIQKRQGDLSFKYLDMSKYFQNRSNPTYIKINTKDLIASLDYQIIKRQIQEGLIKENLYQNFINNLCDDFEKMGVKLNKNRVRQATQYQVSNKFYKFFASSKQLKSQDINSWNQQYVNQAAKDQYGRILYYRSVQKIVFFRICNYFIFRNEQLSEQDQVCKAQLLSNLTVLQQIIHNFQNVFYNQIMKQSKTRYQKSSNQLIAIRLANIAIKSYTNSLNTANMDQIKMELQHRIIRSIQKDLNSINIQLKSIDIDINNKNQIKFIMMKTDHEFRNLDQLKYLLKNFSKYWINNLLLKSCSAKKQNQQNTKSEITIGFFKRKEISVKKGYQNRPILQKYINKQYNQFLNEMKRSNFTQFIRQELKYDTVFEDIYLFAVKQKLEDHDLNQAIQKIKVYTNELVDDINKDLKQVSQTVRYWFIAQLHFYSCHLLWKMRERNEWEKKEKIIISFNQKKDQQLKRFLDLASGQPHLQNMGCAQKIIELYVQQINKYIKEDREQHKKIQRDRFKQAYSRDYVQIKIDQELNDTSKPQKQLEEKIYKYLLTPVEYLKQKYEEYYTYAVEDLKKYKYSRHTNIIKDLLESVIQFRDKTESEESCITDQIFQGQISESKEAYFIPLIVEVLRQKYASYVGSENKVGLKIKAGKLFKIDRTLKQKENQLFLQTLLSQNILITNLKIFLDCFAKLLEDLRVSNKGISVDYTLDEINGFKLSLTVNICSATCPCCKRNCDVDMAVDPNHTKHKCSYGHQMRAIRGFRIESTENNQLQYKASIQRCQDIENDSTFNFNGKDYTWSQFKKEKKEWDLTFTDKNKNEAQFANYWKIAGKRICDFYVNQDGIPMKFLDYSRQNIKKLSKPPVTYRPTNYIFALDESGSMSGNPWNELMKAIKSSISDISGINKGKNQFLSIFKFNESTTEVCEFVQPQSFNPAQIVFGSGCTLFTPAFKLARQIIERHTDVDNVFVLISDGDAEQPTVEITKIKKLQTQATKSGRRVDYVSMLIGGSSTLMEKMKTALNGRHDNITNAANVSSIFKEILKKKQ